MRIGRREVSITNPDKLYFPEPGLTKGDLVTYYLDVAAAVLNHVQRRPMQMKRYPEGVDGFFFYQKRVPEPHPDWLETVHIKFPSGRTADFPVCNEPAAIAWIANLGCIELHTWHSRVNDVDRPDYLLIDLDPSEGNPWSHVREIALVVKEVMDELGLTSFPKTSGATGLHILAPIKPELEFPQVRDFAKALAKEVERRIDDQDVATTTWKVADRRGVFVDYGQNARDRTIAVAPLVGGRAIKGPTVALMRARRWRPDALGVAEQYRDIAAGFVLDAVDEELHDQVEALGYRVATRSTMLDDPSEARAVAWAALHLFDRATAA